MSAPKSELREWMKAIIMAIGLAIIIKLFIFEFIQIDGNSMFPTLAHQERFIVNKFQYILHKPQIGDVVVFEHPHNNHYQLIKRVVAKEGDTIEIIDGQVFVNNKRIKESYILEKTSENFKKRMIPRNTVFVLGDNRNNSKDSRFEDIGFIPLKLVKGKVIFRIFPVKNFGKLE
ncbi:signal peptidase I [Clostridiaceae bacterium 35-E11]